MCFSSILFAMGKVALAIHDLSCFAKSSLTVVLPVLEALNVECAVLPTALISTQTDGYDSIYFQDETDSMEAIFEKHRSLGIVYDGIYSGFLGSVKQMEIVERVMNSFSALNLVDPVLGDNGMLYKTMSKEHIDNMKKLVKRADIITPNYTEAIMLTSSEYKNELSMGDIDVLLSKVKALGPGKGVITSVPLKLGSYANIAYSEEGMRIFHFDDLGISYPGAGDLFASILFSLYLGGHSFFSSSHIATEIASESVSYALKEGRERRRGVDLAPVFKEIKRRML
mgnify:CR=1 FL=1